MDPTAELTGLPDVPTRAIVSLLPLQQLIVSLPRVHPRFAPLRATVLRRNSRLSLHIGNHSEIKVRPTPLSLPYGHLLVDHFSGGHPLYPDTYLDDFHRLRLATLDSHIVLRLSSLMPAIVHLEVVLDDVGLTVLCQLTILLALWAPTLRTLHLTIGSLNSNGGFMGECSYSPAPFRLLLGLINSTLTALEHLRLDLCKGGLHLLVEDDRTSQLGWTYQLGWTPQYPAPRLPVLSRLREFHFWAGNHPSVVAFILEQLHTYATDKLTSIGLAGEGPPWWDIAALAQSRLAHSYTRLPISRIDPTMDCTLICRAFPNLTVCNLNCTGLGAEQLAARLSALSTLANLQSTCLEFFTADSLLPLANFVRLPPLSSLKILRVSFWTRDSDAKHGHDRLEGPFWAHLFPAVEIVQVRHSGRLCGACYPNEDETSRRYVNYFQAAACLSQLLAPLKVLPSLRRIFYGRAGQFDDCAEFTPAGTFAGTYKHRT